jgi:hypothetical protein
MCTKLTLRLTEQPGVLQAFDARRGQQVAIRCPRVERVETVVPDQPDYSDEDDEDDWVSVMQQMVVMRIVSINR